MTGDSGSMPPPKPWERVGGSSGSTPFKPSSPGNTSHIIEASGTAKPGEIVSTSEGNSRVQRNDLGRPVPSRPWEQTYGNNYGGYNSGSTYNSGYGYGSGMYGSSGAYGGSGGLYGVNNMYNRGYGGIYGSSGLYGGGMYNSNFGSPMGGYGGMGMGGPYGDQDPNNPFASPSSPPGFWVSFLRVMHGVVTFFGRIAMLIDQNTQAFHIFISALLQLFDRSGLLYGELARFVLRLLGIQTKSKKQNQLESSTDASVLEAPKVASGSWDNVWANDSAAKRE